MARSKAQLVQDFQETLAAAGYTVDAVTLDKLARIAQPERPLTEHQRMVTVLCAVMGQDLNLCFTRYTRLAKNLLEGGYTTELIEKEYGPKGGFYLNDWRGQRGSLPTEPIIKETIAQAQAGWKALDHGLNRKGTYKSNQRTVYGNDVGDAARADARRLSGDGGAIQTLRPETFDAPF